MNARGASPALSQTVVRAASNPSYLPPRLFEYWYYGQMFYAVMGAVVGVAVGLIGAAMLAILAACCVLRLGRRSLAILMPVALPIACGVSFIAVQVLVFGQSITAPDVRQYFPWILGLVIIQYLAFRRSFLHRFAVVTFLVGLCMLPFLGVYRGTGTRVGLKGGISVANPNDLSAWFGFCWLYFTILSLETRRMSVRLMSSLAAVGSMLVVLVTVSRGPLFAGAVGILVALRRVLKRGFVPVVSLAAVAWIAYGLGLFDQAASLYASRGLEETGRFLVWPLAIDRFLKAPLTGVGASNVATWVPGQNIAITPHNSFILIGLGSGILPLLCFIAYWGRLGVDAFRLSAHSHEDAAFLVPLFLYVFLIALELNGPFMFPWAMATLGSVGSAGFLLNARLAAQRGGLHSRLRQRNAPMVVVTRKT